MDRKIGPNKGKKFSEEWRKKLSESHKGKKISNQTREKMSKRHKEDYKNGKRIPSWKGKKMSKESNLKRSLKLKGRKFSKETKKKMSKSAILSYQKGKIKFIGNKNPAKRPEVRKKISKKAKGNKNGIGNKANTGKKLSEETKRKQRLSAINYINLHSKGIQPHLGKNEKQILDRIEQEFNYRIIRQYFIDGYFVDGYIPEINCVIEIDERPKTKQRDIDRENYIKNKLNCKFVRIKDYE
jgi:very-short-patch-repair endonuclease